MVILYCLEGLIDSLIFFKDFIYLFMRDPERERERQSHRQREMQAPCREPDVGFDPGTPGSRPGPKADVQLLSHPGVPTLGLLICKMGCCLLLLREVGCEPDNMCLASGTKFVLNQMSSPLLTPAVALCSQSFLVCSV